MSTPDSAATLRAAGDDLTSAPAGGVACSGAGAGVGGDSALGAAAGGAAAAGAVPAVFVSSISPRTSSTFTTSPSFLAWRATTPALRAGTSTVILSVSSSTTVSPAATASPSCLVQRETVASTIDSPSGGTFSEIIRLSWGAGKPGQPYLQFMLLAASC